MKWRCIVMITSFLLGFAPGWLAPMQAASGLPETDLSAGRKAFVQYCAACHGAEGRGDGPVASSLRTPPADLTRIAHRRGGQFPAAEIAAYIDGRVLVQAHGSREMPVWGQHFSKKYGGGTVGEEFVRGHLLILVDYLKSIQR